MTAAPSNFPELVKIFLDLIKAILSLVMLAGVLVFFWGLVKFIAKAGEKDAKEGKSLMVWGLIALFVMFSFWGIMRFAYGELEFARPFGLPLLPDR